MALADSLSFQSDIHWQEPCFDIIKVVDEDYLDMTEKERIVRRTVELQKKRQGTERTNS